MSNMEMFTPYKGIKNESKKFYYPADKKAGGIADSDMRYSLPKSMVSGGGDSEDDTVWVEQFRSTGILGTSTYGGTEYIIVDEPADMNTFLDGDKIKFNINGEDVGTTNVLLFMDSDDETKFSHFGFEPPRFAGEESPWMVYSWDASDVWKLNYNGPDAPNSIDVIVYVSYRSDGR